jgi:hypothetical protein
MPQLNFYVPKELADELRALAKARGIPVSKYLAEIAAREVGGGWPDGYFETAVGFWEGELERPEDLPLTTREAL